MNKFALTGFFYLLITLQNNAFANEDFIAEQRSDFDTLSVEDIKIMRQDLLTMSAETLERLYQEQPEAKELIENAYGYGVFEGQAVNLVLYVAGKGLGVVFDNKTKTPIFMNAIRGGTGPGIGYKSLHGVFIFSSQTAYEQFTTLGLQISASGDATMKVGEKGFGADKAVSLVPGVKFYQLTDIGIVLQANWGATEFLKDPNLNN